MMGNCMCVNNNNNDHKEMQSCKTHPEEVCVVWIAIKLVPRGL